VCLPMGLVAERHDMQQPLEAGHDHALLPHGRGLVPRLGLRMRVQPSATRRVAMHAVSVFLQLPMQLQPNHDLLGRPVRHGVCRRLQAALVLRIGYGL
jgi:hypothetical protein